MTSRRLRWAVAVYLLLLAASHLARWWTPEEPVPEEPAPQGLESASVAAVDGERRLERRVRLAWHRWQPGTPAVSAGAPVLVLHGSPGSHDDFGSLARALADRGFEVVAPDLPGFGASSHDVPDYSVRAHAAYALDLLDRLGAEQAHLVGFSMGGGVALEMVRQAPSRVRSVTLLSAIGVQELELLGDYRLNHALHGLQLAGLWAIHELVPHFGALDDAMLSVAYARNFYDTDQRPLRGVLERLEAPTLIVHGRGDVLVPLAAAEEHHRIVPQSEEVLLEGNHFLVFRRGAELAQPIADFLERVDAGEARDRAAAVAERVARATAPFDPSVVPPPEGMTLLVVMALLAAATLVSEDLACIATGILVAEGRLGLFAGVLACFVGILVGDLLLFWAGRWLGRPWLVRRPLRWFLTPERVERSSRWFSQRGPQVILASRFLPGMRLPTYFAAGLLRTSFLRFLGWFMLAVGIWAPILVGLSAAVGTRALVWLESLERWALPGFAAVALLLWLLFRLVEGVATWRGRRRLLGRWIRLTRWEFWPPWVLYPPVVAKVLALGLRHRSPTLFTAANPGIPLGGFVGESKSAILDCLPRESVARYRRMSGATAQARLDSVRSFAREEGLGLPLVLKPDAGERGKGVTVVRTWDEAAARTREMEGPHLVQEYVAGPELGVFWLCLPGEETGRIFSVTEKRLPEVVGDGVSTVERLILADPRAVAMASTYLDNLADRLDEVPEPGERLRLTDLGTHCRGAVFVDGRRLVTPALERAVEAVSRSFEGFWFGRYDLRSDSVESFAAGRFRILELNGVTSEATHIYDPTHSVVDAWRVLFRQWELAFEIGSRNRRRGVEPATVASVLRALAGRRDESQDGGTDPAPGM